MRGEPAPHVRIMEKNASHLNTTKYCMIQIKPKKEQISSYNYLFGTCHKNNQIFKCAFTCLPCHVFVMNKSMSRTFTIHVRKKVIV